MKIVKFENGKYGIRRGNWFSGYEYLDLDHIGHIKFFSSDTGIIKYCQSTLEDVQQRLIQIIQYTKATKVVEVLKKD